MASPVGRVSTLWSVGLSLGAALAFFAAARQGGEAPWAGAVGGSVWVFLLALIVSLPLVTGWAKRRSAARDAGWSVGMDLAVAMWACTVPFLVLLLGPWLGWRVTLAVVLAWAAVMAGVCWVLCAARRVWSDSRGGG